MKRTFVIVGLLVVAALAFAQNLPAMDIGLAVGGSEAFLHQNSLITIDSTTTGSYSRYHNAGPHAALEFTATYVQFGAGIEQLSSSCIDGSSDGWTWTEGSADSSSYLYVPIYLLGRYPMAISQNTKLVPSLGAQYLLCLASTNSAGTKLSTYSDFSKVGVLGGLGFEYAPEDSKIILRTGVLADFTVYCPYEAARTGTSSGTSYSYSLWYFDWGLKFNFAVAYKL